MLPLVLLMTVTLGTAKVTHPIDLTHSFDDTTIVSFTNIPFRFISTTILPEGLGESDWYAASNFETAEHGGTHMDVPWHFNREGWKLGEIPFERFFGKAVYLNLREQAGKDRNYRVGPSDFMRWESQHGPMPQGAIVMLDFGWSAKYSNVTDFFGTTDRDDQNSYQYPSLGRSGAEWLVGTGKIYGVGTDALSMDAGLQTGFAAHKVLLENNLYILEHVAYPAQPLDPTGYSIHALPMKIRNGTGAPCRILAYP